MRGREQRGTAIERLGLQRRNERQQPADRIFRPLRIGDMALPAGHDQVAIERAAAADLDGVAQFRDIARLAQNAVVEFFAVLGRPLQKLGRAVDRDAFLVAGDQERERAAAALLRLAAIRREMIEHGGECAGDAALHVDRAAAVELAVRHFAGKRRMCPGLFVARRYHVGMAGEHEMRRGIADAGIEILHVVRAGLAERHAVHREAGRLQGAFEELERAAFRRRDGTAAQQIAGNGDGIGRHD